jgi:predicted dehydrogenase
MRFAIIGTNFVSDMFMEGALSIKECEVVAVCSRNPQNAQRFAEKYNIPNVFDTYAEMCAWGGFDVAYVATPNSTHKEITEFFLNAGFHVFCEKPMASNYNEVKEMVDCARRNNVYLHEGVLPLYSENFKIIKENLYRVGRIRQVNINMSQYSSRYDAYLEGKNPTTFRRELCNGATMDLGVYTLALSIALFGEPKSTQSASVMLDTGVDVSSSSILVYDGFLVNLAYSKANNTTNRFEICGEKGSLIMDHPTRLQSVTFKANGSGECVELAVKHKGLFYYEIEEMIECIKSGKTESDSVPLDMSLALHKQLTRIRANGGIVFPADEAKE